MAQENKNTELATFYNRLEKINQAPLEQDDKEVCKKALKDLSIDIKKLNTFDSMNFNHDVFGIRQHYNYQTGELGGNFSPKSRKKQTN